MAKILRTTLVDEYGDAVYRLCRRLAFSKEDADDLFQETFLQAFERMPKLNEADDPKGFLFSTSIYIWKSWKRKYARRKRIAPTAPLDETEASDVNLEESYLEQEEVRLVRELVSALPDKFRIPMILYYTAGMSIPEISETMKIPIGTVKSRLFQARKNVEKGLGTK
ncbi:MAG: RNA polymerase sigma factor [Clostridiales Family XIII bacterium]|nr:RNA polymerase sigma factor [Clostridiales Family XIII bacterium]